MRFSRRRFVGALGALGAAAVLPGCAVPRTSSGASTGASLRGARVVVVGGGFGGATCARYLKRAASELDVTVVEPATRFVTCPMSNAVLGGLRDHGSITHDYRAFAAFGVTHVRDRAAALDLTARQVVLAGGARLSWDRLVLAPGIEFDYSGIEGADAAVAERLPHAWKAGPQTELLARQLRVMRPGGLFVMAIPDNPYRCPPGPYERASLVADYLRRHNPTAKVLLLDAKDSFSKQDLFEEAWAARHPGMIERLSRSDGARLTAIDGDRRTFVTEFDSFTADVGNFIPPQRAPALLREAGLDAGLGWCEVHPATFESRVAAGVHVVGDAINANPMPKSAFVANNQAKACAAAVVAGLRGEPPPAVLIANTCYSLVAADYGISITGLYRPSDAGWAAVEGSVGTSPTGASEAIRAQEARYAFDWYQTIVADTFG